MKTLSSLKVSEKTIDNIKEAIKKYNEKTIAPLTLNEFRRSSYELLAQLILRGLDIPFKLR